MRYRRLVIHPGAGRGLVEVVTKTGNRLEERAAGAAGTACGACNHLAELDTAGCLLDDPSLRFAASMWLAWCTHCWHHRPALRPSSALHLVDDDFGGVALLALLIMLPFASLQATFQIDLGALLQVFTGNLSRQTGIHTTAVPFERGTCSWPC